MRHRKFKTLQNRFTSWRKATLIGLAKSLLTYQSIRTTETKAKAIRPLFDKLISLAKKNDLNARRAAFQILGDHKLVSLLFNEIGPRFTKRTGGYTRAIKLENRRGDGAQIVLLELTEIKKKAPKKIKKEKEPEAEEKKGAEAAQEIKPAEEKKPRTETAVKEEKPPMATKPQKKFLGGLRSIFKKERDSL